MSRFKRPGWIDKSETNCGHREWRNKYFKIYDLITLVRLLDCQNKAKYRRYMYLLLIDTRVK